MKSKSITSGISNFWSIETKELLNQLITTTEGLNDDEIEERRKKKEVWIQFDKIFRKEK